MKTSFLRSLGLTLLLVSSATLASAQSVQGHDREHGDHGDRGDRDEHGSHAQGPFSMVRIVVKDLTEDREIGTIDPGGTFGLLEGDRVRLIMTAVPTGHGRDVYYPETEFTETEPGRGWVRISRTNVENATATVEVVAPHDRNRNRVETIRYRITDTAGIPDRLRQGSFTIRVSALPQGNGGMGGMGTSADRSREIVGSLYHAILMRSPDEGSRPYAEIIQRRGFDGVLDVATRIANSDESRIRMYEKQGVCYEQRLLSLYRFLIGITGEEIGRKQWDADLQRMRNGQLDQVVRAIVSSEKYRRRFSL
jgi:hypothetical protein